MLDAPHIDEVRDLSGMASLMGRERSVGRRYVRRFAGLGLYALLKRAAGQLCTGRTTNSTWIRVNALALTFLFRITSNPQCGSELTTHHTSCIQFLTQGMPACLFSLEYPGQSTVLRGRLVVERRSAKTGIIGPHIHNIVPWPLID